MNKYMGSSSLSVRKATEREQMYKLNLQTKIEVENEDATSEPTTKNTASRYPPRTKEEGQLFARTDEKGGKT